MTYRSSLLLTVALVWVGCAEPHASPVDLSLAAAYVPGGSELDVTYCSPDGVGLKMDFYYPSNSTPKPAPAVVWVHGGQWVGGDKWGGPMVKYDVPRLVAKGYVVGVPNYTTGKLTPPESADVFPKYIRDVRCALRYMKANAALYQVDTMRFALMGHSAGAQIAAIAAFADDSLFRTSEWAGYSHRVEAVVTYACPCDLRTAFNDYEATVANEIQLIFSDSATREAGTVMNYVSPGEVPTMVVHGVLHDTITYPAHLEAVGTLDESVYLANSTRLVAALQAVGSSVTFLGVINGGHQLTLPSKYKDNGWTVSPSRLGVWQKVWEFLDLHVKN